QQLREEIFKGLSTEKKYISSKFFYDGYGSELFEQITRLPEYYPTRTEKGIIQQLKLSFLKKYENLTIVEIGSGDYTKISLLLRNIPVDYLSTLVYIPIDISQSAIEKNAQNLVNLYPQVRVQGMVADFLMQLNFLPDSQNRLFCFFGSTIGNFSPPESRKLMKNISEALYPNEYLLVGFDNIKDVETLEKAYNDAQGVTAKFNLNILNAVNNISGTNFNTSDFKHFSFYNMLENRIEMHLEALKDLTISSIYFPKTIQIKKGERIHTENSYKFNTETIQQIAEQANLELKEIFTDENRWFSLALFRKK
ncbi:MAG: L-histidine N(alpha)-methyltransferase, partial [Bacteroidales bacterium]|nr:L-histidine N(alpha)-methyltransferase [Bacteroidales bacterium]